MDCETFQALTVLRSMKTKRHLIARCLLGTALPVLALQVVLSSQATAMSSTHGGPSDDFAPPSLEGWSERSFAGNTDYRIVAGEGADVLMGHTQGQASILYKEQTVDLSSTPIINWSWKVDRTFPDIDEKSKGGDDYPARLYVVAQTGFLPWETHAINYVWASTIEQGQSWENPFTEKAKMVAIQSGNEMVGQWTAHSRDVAEDFRQLFGIDIDELSGFAVMVDGDNSGVEATAWFGKIEFTADGQANLK